MSRLTFCFVFLAVALAVGCYVLQKLVDRMIETKLKMEEMAKDSKKTEENLLAVLESRDLEMKLLSDDLKNSFEERIMYITEKVENLKGRIENVELPKVAFSAYNSEDKILQIKETIVLLSVLINEANEYDTKTGIFTAPVNGLYLFSAHLCVSFAIVLNDEWIARGMSLKNNDCYSTSVLTRMVSGDKVWIIYTLAGYTYPNKARYSGDEDLRNSFMGVLLHK